QRAPAWHWHQPRDDRHLDPRLASASDEVEVVLVVEEELRDEEVRAGFDLQPHVAKLVLDVWALGMLFRAARGADAEAVSAPAHKGDEVAPVRELRIGGDERLTGCRRVAAKCVHVDDAFAVHPVLYIQMPA